MHRMDHGDFPKKKFSIQTHFQDDNCGEYYHRLPSLQYVFFLHSEIFFEIQKDLVDESFFSIVNQKINAFFHFVDGAIQQRIRVVCSFNDPKNVFFR